MEKKRPLKVKRDIDEANVLNLIKESENYKKYIGTGNIKKQIFVKNRLINLII